MSPAPVYETDWTEIWKYRQGLQESTRTHSDSSHNWDKKENAERYDRNASGRYDDRVKRTIEALPLTPHSRVLDIGAGPGVLALPLAPHVQQVTAVEPGAGMVEVLRKHAENEGIRNITCIQKLWEETDPARDLMPPYDIVIASLSLTMPDIREALSKMDAVCSGSVHLFWFADMPFWERMYADLWEPLHKIPYHPGPKADCLFGILYQMGIFADVTMLPMKKEYRFRNREEMQTFFCKRFGATTPGQADIISSYLEPLIQVSGEEYSISGDSTLAHIRWNS
ncbi:MAG: class I SAM-dependent methyltransferase [Methanomicrobiales archaeon]|nr:class I SAM-dependent methyltransferase [Methanomicrobiales archaeon]